MVLILVSVAHRCRNSPPSNNVYIIHDSNHSVVSWYMRVSSPMNTNESLTGYIPIKTNDRLRSKSNLIVTKSNFDHRFSHPKTTHKKINLVKAGICVGMVKRARERESEKR